MTENERYYKDLTKKERKDLRKEFEFKTKQGRAIVTVAILVAAMLVIFSIVGIIKKETFVFFIHIPLVVFGVLIPIYAESCFIKWLKQEKNIIYKKK